MPFCTGLCWSHGSQECCLDCIVAERGGYIQHMRSSMPESKFNANDVKDVLLADVAIRIQLSPTNYRLATKRMEALADWLDREGSELAGLVQLVYAQGSMAVNATIASCLTNDE